MAAVFGSFSQLQSNASTDSQESWIFMELQEPDCYLSERGTTVPRNASFNKLIYVYGTCKWISRSVENVRHQ